LGSGNPQQPVLINVVTIEQYGAECAFCHLAPESKYVMFSSEWPGNIFNFIRSYRNGWNLNPA
jgi:hypothetical protein